MKIKLMLLRMKMRYLGYKILSYIRKPFNYLEAIVYIWKIYRYSPNRWERYLKLKEIEKEAQEREKIMTEYTKKAAYIGTIARFATMIVFYASYLENPDETTPKKINEMQNSIYVTREEFRIICNELEKLGVDVPEEAKELVFNTKIDEIKDIEQAEKFNSHLWECSDLTK